jgi:phosphatidyl-myo-inositol dimannoside synthase
MSILLLATEYPPGPGGIGTHASHIAEGLLGLGWRVRVCAVQDYAGAGEVETYNARQKFPVIRLNPPGEAATKLYSRWRIADQAIRAEKPSMLLASGQRAVWMSAALAARHGIPWVAVGHGTEFGVRQPARRMLNRHAYGAASGVICVSHYTWRQLRRAGIQPQDGRIIHNGADPATFRRLPEEEIEAFRAAFGYSGKRLIVTVGNVTERKGQDNIIRALPRVLRHVPDVQYAVIGLPSRAADFRAVAQEHGVVRHVDFLGRLSTRDVVRALNAADLFVMTSRYTDDGDFEGFGIAAVEAALCGTPAVVSRDSGLAEAVVEGVTGLAVPADDPDAVAHALVELLQDRQRALDLGAAAERRARKYQTWDRVVLAYDEFLRHLGGDVPRARRRLPAAPVARARPRPHVMHVIDSLALGGAERMLVELANAAQADGYRLSVCVTRSESPLATELADGIELHVLRRRSRFGVRTALRFAEIVRSTGVDLLHAHGRSTCAYLTTLKGIGLLPAPILLHDHYGRIEMDGSVPAWLRYFGNRNVAGYVGVCPKHGEWARRARMPVDRTWVVPNALNQQRLLAARRLDLHQEFGISPGVPVGVVVGNLKPEKGILFLLDAIAASSRGRDATYLLVGREDDPGYAEQCRQRLAEHGLGRVIRFIGARSNVPEILRSADFSVLPSRSEAGQLVLLEAVLARLPVVATMVGEVPERLSRLGVEEFVSYGAVGDFAAALDALLELGPEERRDRGEAGAARASHELELSAVMPRWYEVYDSVLGIRA